MGVGSIPDSPPMPAGETAEERERAWTAAHPPTAQNNSYDTNVRPQQQYSQPPQQQHFQPPQQPYTTYGGQGLYPQPVEGIFVRGPLVAPQPGQVLLGYQVCEPTTGCCQCENLSPAGWISVILLLILFWPLFWIPFVMPECYERYQIPVYGHPGVSTQHAGSVGQGMPIAQPVNQQHR